MNKAIGLIGLMVVAALMTACAGRTPMPVASYQYGDEQKSCEELRAEMAGLDKRVQELLPDSQKTGKNVALGVAGAFFLVPWFFMDFSDSEKVEIRAYQDRAQALNGIMIRKQCAGAVTPAPQAAE